MSGDVLKTIKLGDVSDYGPISIKHKYNLDFLKSLVNKEKKNTHTQWNYRATPFIYCLTGILVLNICSLCYQSIASGNGPVRRLHIFLVKHIRFPTTQRPRGRTSRLIHKPKGPLNPLGTSPCLPV